MDDGRPDLPAPPTRLHFLDWSKRLLPSDPRVAACERSSFADRNELMTAEEFLAIAEELV
jgi:hypothetical protein